MNIVLIHIGPVVPDYMIDCMEQVRRFYGGEIHAVIPDSYVCKNFIKRIGIHPVACESFYGDPLYREFQKVCFLDGFWNVTMARFIVLDILIQRKNLTDVIHIENDVLLYRDPNSYRTQLEIASNRNVLLTPVGENYASAAFIYVKNLTPLRRMNERFIEYLKKGKAFLNKILGNPDPTEMMMLSYFYKHFENVVSYLPIVPEGKGSNRYRLFNSVFDGASAGQYIGGTRSDGPGWTGNHHWLGCDIQRGKYQFVWSKNAQGIKIPFMVGRKGRKVSINNLHIHSKDLRRWM
jgi:hypothetical protein